MDSKINSEVFDRGSVFFKNITALNIYRKRVDLIFPIPFQLIYRSFPYLLTLTLQDFTESSKYNFSDFQLLAKLEKLKNLRLSLNLTKTLLDNLSLLPGLHSFDLRWGNCGSAELGGTLGKELFFSELMNLQYLGKFSLAVK